MVSLIILLLLAWNFYLGYSRGLFLQAFYLFGSLVAIVVASLFKSGLAQALNLWIPYANPTQGGQMAFFTSENVFDLNRLYYAGVAFLVIYLAVYLVFRFLGVFAHAFEYSHLEEVAYQRSIAGGLAVLNTAFGLAICFTLLATVPMTGLQNFLADNWLVKLLITIFPKFLFGWGGSKPQYWNSKSPVRLFFYGFYWL